MLMCTGVTAFLHYVFSTLLEDIVDKAGRHLMYAVMF